MCVTVLFLLVIAGACFAEEQQQRVPIPKVPDDCFHNSQFKTFTEFVDCMTDFILKKSSITPSSGHRDPTDDERGQFRTVVRQMLEAGEFQCNETHETLPGGYSVKVYQEYNAPRRVFCVLYCSRLAEDNSFEQGWGLFAVIASKAAVQHQQLHLSACHSITDGPVQLQVYDAWLVTKESEIAELLD